MTLAAASSYQVEAFNTAKASENKIHDDEVARRFGFGGGLVPGVDVYAYMTHPAVEAWGAEWLRRGVADCRFMKPVYEGRIAAVTAQPDDDGGLAIRVESEGQLCAEGSARLPDKAAPPPALDDFPVLPLPDERPPASPEAMPVGAGLGTYTRPFDADEAAGYLADVREDLAIYRERALVHPGHILRFANWGLSQNVVLGPWIHVGSEIRHFDHASHGEDISVRSRVLKNYEHKGHRFVELDCLVLAGGDRALAQVHHTAIYEPRQVRG